MKKFFAGVLVLAACFSLVLNFCGAKPAEAAPRMIKLPFIYGEGHPTAIALEEFFKKEVEEKSNGTLRVELYPASTLATEEQIYEGLRNGTYEMGMMGIIMQDTLPAVSVFQLPFLFKDYADAKKALVDEGYGLKLLDGLAEQGIKVYTVNADGFRIMTLNRKIEKIDDFSEFKLRTANFENMIRMGEFLGCAVTPMAMNEVFSALEQRVIDGQENPPSTIRASGWYEIQEYMLVSNHVFSPNFTCINIDFYNSLTDEQKKVIDDAAYALTDVIWEKASQASQQDIDFMGSTGIEVYYPSDAFRQDMVNATLPLYDILYEKAPNTREIVKAIQSLQ